MTRHQHFRTRTLKSDDVRQIGIKCPFCDTENGPVDVGMDEAKGAIQCCNCQTWFEYAEYYTEEQP